MLRITALTGLLIGCGGGQSCPDLPPAAHTAAPDRGSGPTGPSDCPMNQPGVDVAVTDVQEGAMLTLKSPPEGVARVRAIGRHIETLHARRAEPAEPTIAPAAAVVAEDIENGIRLVFIAETPSDVENLRSSTRAQAERIRTARCPDEP